MGVFNNQYLLTTSDSTLRLPDSFEHHGSVSRHAIYASEHLSVAVPDSGRDVVVLGDIIDPGDPMATNEDVTEDLVSHSDGRSLFERLQRYSGRFVVVAAGAEGTVAVPDAVGQRRVLYTDDAETITSSPKLFLDAFGYEQRTDPAVAEFLDSGVFWENDAAWPGTKTADRRLRRVLPNHYLDVDDGTVERRPLHQPPISTRRDILDLIEETLTGTLVGVAERYDDIEFSLLRGWIRGSCSPLPKRSKNEHNFRRRR